MFYDNFVRLCNSIGKTPSAVVTEIGFSRASASGWKNGKTPTDATVLRLADYFGVTADYLLGNEEKPAAADELDELVKDELVGFYGDVKKELTPGDIEDIKTLMKLRAELNRSKGK